MHTITHTAHQIVPHLWFDTQAKEAAEFYAAVIPDSRILSVTTIPGTPSGDMDVVMFDLYGQRFQAISAGPQFTFTPAISFAVTCDTAEQVDSLVNALGDGGTMLVPLDAYPFNPRFAWFNDRYGLSWQVSVGPADATGRRITPTLMFTSDQVGKAEEAVQLYTSLFPDSQIAHLRHYGEGAAPNAPGTLEYAAFTLAGQPLGAMDSNVGHDFTFNEAVSLIVYCDTQEQIDHYWDGLSADPAAEMCGWLKDRFGVSWQVVPVAMDAMMMDTDAEKVARVMEAVLQMKKLDLAALQRVSAGDRF